MFLRTGHFPDFFPGKFSNIFHLRLDLTSVDFCMAHVEQLGDGSWCLQLAADCIDNFFKLFYYSLRKQNKKQQQQKTLI